MLRAFYCGARMLGPTRVVSSFYSTAIKTSVGPRCYSTLLNRNTITGVTPLNSNIKLSENAQILSIAKTIIPCRTVTKFSLRKGKRKTVKVVTRKFFRLHWGGWIRTRCGRHKKLWKKSPGLKRRLRQHVFCNGTQSRLLDKMVTNFWKRPKYYVDDPYEPYHTREEFLGTRKNPIVRNN